MNPHLLDFEFLLTATLTFSSGCFCYFRCSLRLRVCVSHLDVRHVEQLPGAAESGEVKVKFVTKLRDGVVLEDRMMIQKKYKSPKQKLWEEMD